MEFKHIKIEKDGPFTTIVLNRPEKRNAINMTMAEELRDACFEIDADNENRVIFLRGEGAMFSSGIMEVARKGIFNPEMFTFADVMVVFLAVMYTSTATQNAFYLAFEDLPTSADAFDPLTPEDEWGGRPPAWDFVARLHATREDIPRDGIPIDATAPLPQVVAAILANVGAE